MYPLAFVLVASVWELYKWLGPDRGWSAWGIPVLPRAADQYMPHTWSMVSRLFEREVSGRPAPVWEVVLRATWQTFVVALGAFLIGVLLGIVLAVVMARFKLVERALMPYLAVSQTLPIIVLAPLLATLLININKELVSVRWLPAMVLGVFLAFFPVAVSALKGLQSTNDASLELMDSYAAGWWRTLFKLRFPSAVPYLGPALRLAGAAAVVGVIVGEISTAVKGGVGRLVLSYAANASGDPPKVYAAVFGAALVGLVMSVLVVGVDRYLRRNHPPEHA